MYDAGAGRFGDGLEEVSEVSHFTDGHGHREIASSDVLGELAVGTVGTEPSEVGATWYTSDMASRALAP